MKKLNTLFLFLLFTGSLFAQGAVKKYVLLEHFTNSNCGICSFRNPQFYTNIEPYQDDIHHVTVHPSFPYSSCVFYQHNTTDNNAWVQQFGIGSTPRVAMNGTLVPSGSQLLPVATLTPELEKMSNIWLQVSEDVNGNDVTATVTVHTVGALDPGNYTLHVAIVEKEINQTTGNGESVHYDVFRDMLTVVTGDAFFPANPGESVTSTYNYSYDAAWNSDEIYVLAFVKNLATGEVLNSGTRFDPVLVSTKAPEVKSIQLFPNPVNDEAFLTIPTNETVREIEVFDLEGRRVLTDFSENGQTVRLQTSALASGIYLVKMQGEQGVYAGKLIKQ